MLRIVFFKPETGEVHMTTTVPDMATADRARAHQGMPYVEFDEQFHNDLHSFYIDPATHEHVAFGETPPHHVWDWPTHSWIDPRNLETYRQAKLALVDEWFAQAMFDTTPAAERETWGRQQEEIDLWSQDNIASTPFLDGIAAARGMDRTTFLRKVQANVAAYRAKVQTQIGNRLRLRDSVRLASTVEAIEAIAWPAQ